MTIEAASAWLALVGVFLGTLGTYLMLSAYHPFKHSEFIAHIIDILLRFITLRWRSAIRLTKAVAKAGETLHREKKDLSLFGIDVLFASFFVQTCAAALMLWEIYHKKCP